MPALPSRRENRNLVRALLGGAVLAAVVSASAPVLAADDDVAPDTKIFRSILKGLGLRDDSPNIEYRERSPLVIPQGRNLPMPETFDVKDSNWPVDPESKQKKEFDALNTNSSDTFDTEARPLRPDQMTPGRKFSKPVRRQAAVSNPSGDDGRPLSPSELGYKGGLFGMFKLGKDEEVGKFVAEPPRASLTDPPTGYQTPSPNSPYGLGKDLTPTKPVDYLTEHGTGKN